MGKVVSPKRVGDPWGDPASLVLGAIVGRERKKVGRYLLRAHGLIAGGYWINPVTDNPAHRIPQSICTDGVWLWSSPWSALVVEHGAALPADFLEHIRALNYRPPSLSEERAQEIGISEGLIPSADAFAEAARRQAEYDALSDEEQMEWNARLYAEQAAREAEERSAQSD